MANKMLNVPFRASEEVVDADNLVSIRQQPVA
jgi:hypothetical protein